MASVKASPSPTANPTDRVLKALQNPAWDWRTLEGLAQDAGLSTEQVLDALQSLGGTIDRGKAKDGHEVYRLRRPTERSQPSSSTLFWSYLTKSSSST